jgi:tRNA (guanine37-N1)-methyltransferase
MGTQTFQLPAGLAPESARELDRACLAGGPDNMPYSCEVFLQGDQILIDRVSDESGYLVAQIRAVKKMGANTFYLLDAGFNNLARPILYGAYHPMAICPATPGNRQSHCDASPCERGHAWRSAGEQGTEPSQEKKYSQRPKTITSAIVASTGATQIHSHSDGEEEYLRGDRCRHRVTDDYQFGGGGGMVLKPEPLFAAVEALRTPGARVILTDPRGRRFTQEVAAELTQVAHLILLAGRYEGVDERVGAGLADEMISIGDYVLTGGELPALVIADAVTRLMPGVLGGEGAAERESFASGLLEPPQYTRPEEFRGARVPGVLLSGDHARIARWRRLQALYMTWRRRPDLLVTATLDADEKHWIERFERGETLPDEGGRP